MRKTIIIILVVFVVISLVFILLPDYTRRALIYQHPDITDYLIFPNNIAETGVHQPWVESPLKNSYRFNLETLDSILYYNPKAFLVFRADTLLHEEYFNGHTDTCISNTFSVTKSIIGLLTGCAIRDGYIHSLDDLVSEYIPAFSDKEHGEHLRIYHLLNMSSGLDYNEVYTSPFGSTTRSYYGRDLEKQMLELNFENRPGRVYKYSGANTQLLGMIISSATGMSLSEYASKKLWQPLGAGKDALWSKDRKDGMEKAFCCFTATARDLARLGKLICDSGFWNGIQIIDPEYYHAMTTPSSEVSHKGRPVDFYGFHWWLTDWKGMEVIYARGIKGQYIIAIPSEKLVIIRLGEKRSNDYYGEHPTDLFLYLRAAMKISGKH